MGKLKYVSLTMIVALGVAAAVFAQGGGYRGGRHYNAATEVTFSGAVDEVKLVPSSGRGPGGLHLMVKSGTGIQDVRVGPMSYVTSKNFEFAKGDAITVTGSKVTMGGQEIVIAREIKKGDQVLTLRDAKGIPLWSGRGWHHTP